MELMALSHYDNDRNTRYGDCILLHDETQLIIYDCGHPKHAEYTEDFLKSKPTIHTIYIVVSHNDSDHTAGVCDLLDRLHSQGRYTVKIYTHQYLNHVKAILDKIDDGRRKRDCLKDALLTKFNNIQSIIDTARPYGFPCLEALTDVPVGNCVIVGPTVDQFITVAAQAIDNRVGDSIGEGSAKETVMNAASVQLKCTLSNGGVLLLCGDACPDYLEQLNDYSCIQLPHHGQLEDAKAIFEKLQGQAYYKEYLISDNTGSAENSGGSDRVLSYMKNEKYRAPHNTKNEIVKLPQNSGSSIVTTTSQKRGFLGDLDSIL